MRHTKGGTKRQVHSLQQSRAREISQETFRERAEKILARKLPRMFVVMQTRGKKHGSQGHQVISREFDERFVAIEQTVADAGGVSIRFDQEDAHEDLVGRIRKELGLATFVIADLTDER